MDLLITLIVVAIFIGIRELLKPDQKWKASLFFVILLVVGSKIIFVFLEIYDKHDSLDNFGLKIYLFLLFFVAMIWLIVELFQKEKLSKKSSTHLRKNKNVK